MFEADAVVIGTGDRGLLRSDDDGATWVVVDASPMGCLRDGPAGWYGCPDSAAELGAVGRWDGGWAPVVRFDEIAATLTCPAGSEAAMCDWATVSAAFGAGTGSPTDSGLTDSGTSGLTAPGAPDTQAGAGCGCRSAGSAGPWWLLPLLGWRLRRRSCQVAFLRDEAPGMGA